MEEYGTEFSYIAINSNFYSCAIKCGHIARNLKNNDAKEHLLSGVCRRLFMVQANFQHIKEVALFDGKEPLKKEERVELSIHLNSLYVHVFGILDNLAWALCHEAEILGELELDESNGEVRKQVGLFMGNFRKNIAKQFNDLGQVLNDSSAWFTDLKNKRDPIAHRIPLYAVYSILTETEEKQYQEKSIELREAVNKIELGTAGALLKELGQMGKYSSVFYHQQQNDSNFVDFIQVEQDLDTLNKVITAVFDSFGAL